MVDFTSAEKDKYENLQKHKMEDSRAESGPGEFPGGRSPGWRRIQVGPVPGL